MRRRRPLGAKVLAGFDDAATEDLLPETIDVDPRDERVVHVDEPARESEAVRRLIVAQRMQRAWRAGVDASAFCGEAAAFAQLVGGPIEQALLARDQRRWNTQLDE